MVKALAMSLPDFEGNVLALHLLFPLQSRAAILGQYMALMRNGVLSAIVL